MGRVQLLSSRSLSIQRFYSQTIMHFVVCNGCLNHVYLQNFYRKNIVMIYYKIRFVPSGDFNFHLMLSFFLVYFASSETQIGSYLVKVFIHFLILVSSAFERCHSRQNPGLTAGDVPQLVKDMHPRRREHFCFILCLCKTCFSTSI